MQGALLPTVVYLAVALLIVGGLILGVLSAYTLRRSESSTIALPVLLGAATVWVLSAAAEHLVPTLESKLLISKVQYLGIVALPPASLCTVLAYAGREKWIGPFLTFAFPCALLSWGIALTNDLHQGLWRDLELTSTGGMTLVNFNYGPMYWWIIGFGHGQLVVALTMFFIHSWKSWQWQSTLVMLGFAAPWAANLLYLSGASPIQYLDITPFGLIVTGVCFAYSFHKVGSIFSTVLLANRDIVECIEDLIFVVDDRQRIVSANNSAQTILAAQPLPAPIDIMLAEQPELLHYLQQGLQSHQRDIELTQGSDKTSFDVRPMDVTDQQGSNLATVYVLRDVTLERERESMLKYLASTDPLTNLPNRRHFQDVLSKALTRTVQAGERAALLSLDLDRFKMVNDNYGHPVGDDVLRQVADRLTRNLRFSDQMGTRSSGQDQVTVSRLGGDEFMVLLPSVAEAADAAIVARRLIEALQAPFEVGTDTLQLGTSIGIALCPEDGDSPEALIRRSDQALTNAKNNQKGSFEFYNADLSSAEERRHVLEQALRRALNRDEFRMHYQPIRDAKTKELSGAEALIRWESAELGTVNPGEFIPVAEESGLIVKIGEAILLSVCAQISQWRERGLAVPTISVNLSARQLIDFSLQEQVERIFHETGVSGSDIQFELTEGSVLADNPRSEVMLAWLQGLGATLALDDFGTGYSSLSLLRRVRFQKLKIDQSFVNGLGAEPEDERLVRGVIALAQRLDIDTIAEGVETEEQLAILRSEGCNYIQGYLFGRPEAPEHFERLLKPAQATRSP
ncbi:MAG: diguanylate cyclase (GGDEF)-like protein [Halioglobus sp.]